MEGRLSTVCVLILLLGAFVPSKASSVTPVKPGKCPSTHPDEIGPCIEQCSNDFECNGDLKCCSNGCGHICVSPQTVNPGMCPDDKPLSSDVCATVRLAMCSGDNDCRRHQKCCFNGCGRVCKDANLVKPGVCPKQHWYWHWLEALRIRPQKPECSHDYDCPRNLKCCKKGCTYVCVRPRQHTVKPGVCPKQHWYWHWLEALRIRPQKPECSHDYDCPRNLKCCKKGCTYVCVGPHQPTVNPGVCPDDKPLSSDVCATVRLAMCSGDNDCRRHQKCCFNGCGRVCKDANLVHPGVCPPPLGFGMCAELCSSDSDCTTNQKCCSNGCGHQCMDANQPQVHPGVCPAPSGFGLCAELCSSDSDCTTNQKCCSNGCGHQCMAPSPPKVHPGVCPAPSGFGLCAELCSSDSDCTTNQKCCSNGCGHQCMDANQPQVHPGVRPAPSGFGLCAELCSSDSDCTTNQKCCSNGCGHQCMAPSPPKVHPGVCPQHSGFGLCAELCSSDSDCTTNQKCCSNGCGHQCMDANQPQVHPGVCPAPSGFGLCAELCSSDSDCTMNQKCCSNGCGHQCMAPSPPKVHPGVCPHLSGGVGICAELCFSDSDCTMNQKCCSNGCGHQCTAVN